MTMNRNGARDSLHFTSETACISQLEVVEMVRRTQTPSLMGLNDDLQEKLTAAVYGIVFKISSNSTVSEQLCQCFRRRSALVV